MQKQLSLSFLVIALLIFSLQISVTAQKRSFEDLYEVELKNAGVIQDGTEINGYYFFNRTQEGKRKSRVFELQLVDHNLEPIGKTEFIGSDDMSVTSVAYNGQYLAVRLVDPRADETRLEILDSSGKTIQTVKLPYSLYDHPKYAASQTSMGLFPLYPVKNGFIAYSNQPSKKSMMSKTKYEIIFVPHAEAEDGWTKKSSEKSELFEAAGFLGADDELILNTIYQRKGLLSMDMTFDIVALNTKTGKQHFRYTSNKSRYPVWITEAIFKEDQILLSGTYYEKDGKTMKDRPIGLAVIRLDRNGDEIEEEYISYQKTLGKKLELDNKGRIKDAGNVYIHDVALTPSGELIAIGETYKVFNNDVTIKDGLMLSLTPELEFQSVEILEKDAHTASLGRGVSLAGPVLKGMAAKSLQWFDFEYLQKDGELITASFLNYERRKGEANGFSIYSYTFTEQAFNQNKIRLDSESDNAVIFPARNGYIMVMEYFAKEKRLDTRLERLKL